jgi:CDP-diglyceride synthetase
MKITKSQLKKLIKEELNEMDVASMADPALIEAAHVIIQAATKVGIELALPAVLAMLTASGVKRGLGYKDEPIEPQ